MRLNPSGSVSSVEVTCAQLLTMSLLEAMRVKQQEFASKKDAPPESPLQTTGGEAIAMSAESESVNEAKPLKKRSAPKPRASVGKAKSQKKQSQH